MRLRFVLSPHTLILLVVLLAACQGNPEPTATLAPTLDPAANDGGEAVGAGGQSFVPTDPVIATLNIELPPAGTLVVPTTDPSPGAPSSDVSDLHSVIFTRTGGLSGATMTIELLGDGTLTRDGVTTQVPLEVVDQIVDHLNAINFHRIQGVFTMPGGAPDSFRYMTTVTSAAGSQTIITDDALTPPPLRELYLLLLNLGVEE